MKRQLSGIPGVVEINTWGGYLKQYEVAINPERLRSMNISLLEVFEVLKKNNSVTGGGYIEKGRESYFTAVRDRSNPLMIYGTLWLRTETAILFILRTLPK